MDKIIDYLLDKMNITISFILGIIAPGLLVLVYGNFELFKEIDILKSILLAIIIGLPSYVVIGLCLSLSIAVIQMLLKKVNVKKYSSNILTLSAIGNCSVILLHWKEKIPLSEEILVLGLKECVIVSVFLSVVYLIESIDLKKGTDNSCSKFSNDEKS